MLELKPCRICGSKPKVTVSFLLDFSSAETLLMLDILVIFTGFNDCIS